MLQTHGVKSTAGMGWWKGAANEECQKCYIRFNQRFLLSIRGQQQLLGVEAYRMEHVCCDL